MIFQLSRILIMPFLIITSCSSPDNLKKLAADFETTQGSGATVRSGSNETDTTSNPTDTPSVTPSVPPSVTPIASPNPPSNPSTPSECLAASTSDDLVNGDYWNQSSAPGSYGLAKHAIARTSRLGTYNFANINAYCTQLDNDGVTLPSSPKFASTNSFLVRGTANTGGALNAWIDFNEDGDFYDPGEKIINNVGILAENVFSITFPANPTSKASVTTWVRFRFGPAGIDSTGQASLGEVEDYQITISN